ncbi:hypothetical protein ACE5D9_05325 [Rickettsia sp. 2024-CO-Wats]
MDSITYDGAGNITDYWKNHKVTKENEFAILTNIIHQEWAGII